MVPDADAMHCAGICHSWSLLFSFYFTFEKNCSEMFGKVFEIVIEKEENINILVVRLSYVLVWI